MLAVLKIIGFVGSFLGFLSFAQKKMDTYFAPLFTISCLSLIVYLGGLLHILYLTSIVLYTLGILCFFYILSKKDFSFSLTFPNLCFYIISLFFLTFLLRANFIHTDNFSHWAIVVKDMLETNAFPTQASTLIPFKDIPLGMACWIYYGCLFLGHYPSMMLFLQGTLIFSCLYALLGIIEEKKRFLLYSFLGAGCALFSIFTLPIRMNNLFVDFILSLLTLSSLAIIYTYRHDVNKTWILLPILGLLGIIQNSGFIFILFVLCFYVYTYSRQNNKKYIPVFFLSFIPILLWQVHMKIEFSFDLSQIFSHPKTPNEIYKIIQLYLHSCFDFNSRQIVGILILNMIVILVCLFGFKILNKKFALIKVLLVSDIVLVFYYIGLLGMYIYAMPLTEALRLKGFERYTSSIVVLFFGCLILCATIDLENSFSIKMGNQYNYKAFHSIKTKKQYQMAVTVTCTICILALISEYNSLVYLQSLYPETLPYKVQQVTKDRYNSSGKIDHHKYLVYASNIKGQNTNAYLQYITRYMLYADHVDGTSHFNEDHIVNRLKDYDYLIIVESDKNEKHLLQKYFNVDGHEKIYKVHDLFQHMTKQTKKQYTNIEKTH